MYSDVSEEELHTYFKDYRYNDRVHYENRQYRSNDFGWKTNRKF